MSSIGLISENDNSTVLAEYKGLNKIEFFAEQAEWNNIDKNECDDTSRQLAIKGEEADESESEK